MKVRPYILLGSSQLSQLQASLDRDLRQWVDEWSPDLSAQVGGVTVVETSAALQPEEQKTRIRITSDTEHLSAVFMIDCHAVAALLLGYSQAQPEGVPEASIAQAILEQALIDLHNRFTGCANTGHSLVIEMEVETAVAADPDVCRVQIQLGHYVLSAFYPVQPLLQRIVVQPAAIDDPVPITSLRDALTDKTVSAHVVLGEAELKLDALAKLRVGDVIRLDKGLNDQLRLDIDSSTASFSGFLGRRDDQFAFQVSGLVNG